MMQGAVLKRLGGYLAVASALGLFLVSEGAPIAAGLSAGSFRAGIVIGVAVLALGYLVDATPRRRCHRCGRAAVAGTVFCARHGQELKQASSVVAGQRAKEHRDW